MPIVVSYSTATNTIEMGTMTSEHWSAYINVRPSDPPDLSPRRSRHHRVRRIRRLSWLWTVLRIAAHFLDLLPRPARGHRPRRPSRPQARGVVRLQERCRWA